jgi:hypothetical protein
MRGVLTFVSSVCQDRDWSDVQTCKGADKEKVMGPGCKQSGRQYVLVER